MPTAAVIATQLTTPESPDLSLLIDQTHVIDALADGGLSIQVGSHGNSLGTLSATLNDPAPLPAVEQIIEAYTGLFRLYRGRLRVVDTTEYRGGHVFATLSAQDAGPDEGALPTAAAFGISDDPDGVTTKGYESLSVQTRTTEGGSPKTTAKLVFREHGLWIGMNVEVTSANHGFAAEEFSIVEADVSWPHPDAPRYRLTLGEPLVRLAQVVAEHDVLDGSITTTKISDGAVSTPKILANAVTADKILAGSVTTAKLHADAVIANVLNVAETVAIDADGIEVTGGAITVTTALGTVIIDGTSNLFKIVATGTLQRTGPNGSGAGGASAFSEVSLPTGFNYIPAALFYLATGANISANLPWTTWDRSNGFPASGLWTDNQWGLASDVTAGSTLVRVTWDTRLNRTAFTNTYRFFVLKEEAF